MANINDSLSLNQRARMLAGFPPEAEITAEDMARIAAEEEHAALVRRMEQSARVLRANAEDRRICRERMQQRDVRLLELAQKALAVEIEDLAAATVYYAECITPGEEAERLAVRAEERRWHWNDAAQALEVRP